LELQKQKGGGIMADCSKTIDYLREHNRMCSNFVLCDEGCPIFAELEKSCDSAEHENTDKVIKIVQRWSDENPEIKKCPFCNDLAKMTYTTGYGYRVYSVTCDGCGANGGRSERRAEAIALWNKRAEEVKRGKWVYTGRGNSWECTHCNSCLDMSDDENGHARYCPQCGANMRGGAADE
jgi:Lar family restriction alleviation protein